MPAHGHGLGRYLVRRGVGSVIVITLVILCVSLVFETLADPVVIDLGPYAGEVAYRARRQDLGLDAPYLDRALGQLRSAWTLEWGYSPSQRRSVSTTLMDRLGPTLAYAIPGFCIATTTALGAALWQVQHEGGAVARCLRTASALAVSLSSLIVVIMGQYLLAHRLGWFPVIGWPLRDPAPHGLWWYVALPSLLCGFLQWGPDCRMYRALLVHEARKPHLDALRARGVGRWRVRLHLIHGILGPLLTRIVQRLPYLLVGSIVIEQVFNIPGLGDVIVVAVKTSDLALIRGLAVALALATVTGQLIGDIAAGMIDPRMRTW
ncbi:MAG: ABC transporter permease [Nannocystaceae bacterium]